MSLRVLRSRIERLEKQIAVPARSLTTDEEIRARVAELGLKWWGYSADAITESDRRDLDYLKLHYPRYAPEDPMEESMKAIDEALKREGYDVQADGRVEQILIRCGLLPKIPAVD
jgi:hypothetical protein